MVAGIKAAYRIRLPAFFQRPGTFSMIIHFGPAVGAEHQPSQRISHACGVCPAHSFSDVLCQFPGFWVNDGLVGILKPCVDKKDTSKKRRNKIIQCERKDRFAMSKARKSWIFQNGLSFQKFYAPEMQKPPFADGVNSLSTTPGATGKVRLLWGICISRHCYICFVCLWLFGSNGNSFRYAFRLYLLYQRREGEREWQPRANTLIFR